MKLRHRLRQSPLLTGLVSRAFAGWIRLCNQTARWTIEGAEEVQAAAAQGPVLIVLWHEHLFMAMTHCTQNAGQIMSVHDTSPIGRLAGSTSARLGMTPVAMAPNASNLSVSREVKRQVARGLSIAITGDGPLGPRREMKSAPLDWARVTGLPVFVYSFDMSRKRRLETWDKLVLPRLFARGAIVFSQWDVDVPRRPCAEVEQELRLSLGAALTAAAARASELCLGRNTQSR